jgi:hypothetical protein
VLSRIQDSHSAQIGAPSRGVGAVARELEEGGAQDGREREAPGKDDSTQASPHRRPCEGPFGASRRRKHRIMLEDLALELLQRLTRLEPELLGQSAAAPLVDVERLGLAVGAIERDHELAAQALAKRVPRDERLQLGDDLAVASERKLGVDSLLDRAQAEFLEPLDLTPRERVVGEVRERRAAPERKRRVELRHRGLSLSAGESAPTVLEEPLEPLGVELRRLDLEEIAVAARFEQPRVAVERFAQPGDVSAQRLGGGRWRRVPPELVDQRVGGDDLVCAEQQDRKERTLLPSAELYPPVSVSHLQRPEDPEIRIRLFHPSPRRGAPLTAVPTATNFYSLAAERQPPGCTLAPQTMERKEQLMRIKLRVAAAFAFAALIAATAAVTAVAGSHFSDWSTAQKIDEIDGNSTELNTPFLDGCPIQSPDGLSLYMASNRPGGVGMLDIWVAHRASRHDPWGAPDNLGEPVNSAADDFCPTPIRGDGLFFVSREALAGSCGLGDIYFTRFTRTDGWAEPQHLACARTARTVRSTSRGRRTSRRAETHRCISRSAPAPSPATSTSATGSSDRSSALRSRSLSSTTRRRTTSSRTCAKTDARSSFPPIGRARSAARTSGPRPGKPRTARGRRPSTSARR